MPDVIHRPFEKNKFGDVLLDELEIRVAAEVRDVVHAAGDKIVNADDLVAARQQQIGQMRAEKAGGAGDDGGGLVSFSSFDRLMKRQSIINHNESRSAIQRLN